MTTKQRDALNRKNRIIKRLQAGDKHRAIADDERVVVQYVSRIAIDAGIRTLAPRPTEAQISWRKINAALDSWNAAHGRATAKRAKAPRREA